MNARRYYVLNCKNTLVSGTFPFNSTIIINSVSINNKIIPLDDDGGEIHEILDCDYTADVINNLTVRWFFMRKKRENLVYEWVKNQLPQSFGLLKHHIDLSYQTSSDPNKMFSGIKITNVVSTLSGIYICEVSNAEDDDYAFEKLSIYKLPKSFKIQTIKMAVNTVTVICQITHIFPWPEIKIYMNDKDILAKFEVHRTDKGYFMAVASRTFFDKDVASPAYFRCEFKIYEVMYERSTEIVYYPGSIYVENRAAAIDKGINFNSAIMWNLAAALVYIFII